MWLLHSLYIPRMSAAEKHSAERQAVNPLARLGTRPKEGEVSSSLQPTRCSHSFAYAVTYGDPPGFFSRYFDLDLSDSTLLYDHLIDLVEANHKEILFTKDRTWSYENEFRLAVVTRDDDAFEVDLAGALVGMVLGRDFPDCGTSLVDHACKRYGINIAGIEWRYACRTREKQVKVTELRLIDRYSGSR